LVGGVCEVELSEMCEWLHEQLESLPVIRFPFNLEQLPYNGIYFFYEQGEKSQHHANSNEPPRIVRIGTHNDGNFRNRISEHYLLNESKRMNFTMANAKPSDRSIFRKNIGRALLSTENDYYGQIWEIDFTLKDNRLRKNLLRNMQKEKEIETKINKILRETFSFRFISFEGQATRIGKEGIESKLIGTVSRCQICKPSQDWLGRSSPKPEINNGKLWLSNYLASSGLSRQDKEDISSAIMKTHEWNRSVNLPVF
jgi:hypothetical protein